MLYAAAENDENSNSLERMQAGYAISASMVWYATAPLDCNNMHACLYSAFFIPACQPMANYDDCLFGRYSVATQA